MKKHVTLNSCRHIGMQPAMIGFGYTPVYRHYCVKQFECPDDIHKELRCENCPDFESYEYDMETTNSIKWEGSEI